MSVGRCSADYRCQSQKVEVEVEVEGEVEGEVEVEVG